MGQPNILKRYYPTLLEANARDVPVRRYCRVRFGKEYQSVYRGQPEAVRAGGLRGIDMCAAIHPGEILREEYMAPLGLSANALAVILGIPRNIGK